MDTDPFHDVLSFVLFTVCAALVAVLVWVLLRRLRRERLMCDQETMTVGEPSFKPPSTADSVSAAGASRKDSEAQTSPGSVLLPPPAAVVEGGAPIVGGAPAAEATPVTGAETVSPPRSGATTEGVAEAKAESKSATKAGPDEKRGTADGAASKPLPNTTPADSSQLSGLKKSKRRRSSISKSATEGGSKPPSRRGSLQRSLPAAAAKSSSSSERPTVPALLIRRPSTDSRSSQRSNRSTRYVAEVPKVPPALDVFSREHSSMVESPPSNPAQSPPPVAGASKPSPDMEAKPDN